MSGYYDGGSLLHGPPLAKWLKERTHPQARSEALQKRLREWEKGVQAKLETVDRHLTTFCFHPSELPDELWVNETSPGRVRVHRGS